MIDPRSVSFPISGADLAALQRVQLGRDLTAAELEMFAGIAEMANEAYQAAAHGDSDTVGSILAAVNSVPVPDDYTRHVAALCRGWVLLGCQRGAEYLKAAIDGVS